MVGQVALVERFFTPGEAVDIELLCHGSLSRFHNFSVDGKANV